ARKDLPGAVLVCQASGAGATPARATSVMPSTIARNPDARDVIATLCVLPPGAGSMLLHFLIAFHDGSETQTKCCDRSSILLQARHRASPGAGERFIPPAAMISRPA